MKYFQLTISSKNPGKVTEILSSMEIYSYSISDPADVVDIIENKKKYKCDYVSEELSDLGRISLRAGFDGYEVRSGLAY